MRRLCLCALLATASLALAACNDSDREGTVLETSDDGPVPGATAPGQKPPESGAIDTGTAAETGGGSFEADPEDGRRVFTEAGCGGCHTLATIGSTGETGPDLDEAEPSYEEAVEQITNGGGGMPPFKDQLSEQEISNVAAFVAEATKG